MRVLIAAMVICLAGLTARPAPAQTFSVSDFYYFPTAVGPALTYPINITVSGLTNNITDVNVTISGFFADDVDEYDFVLVGPLGQQVMLMSDVGGTTSYIVNETYTFDQSATAMMSDNSFNPSGTYLPTNYAPAESQNPGAGAGSSLNVYNGTNANGTWRLYAYHDTFGTAPSPGTFRGFSLTFDTTPEPSSWAMMIGGFALVGVALRRRRRIAVLTDLTPSGAI